MLNSAFDCVALGRTMRNMVDLVGHSAIELQVAVCRFARQGRRFYDAKARDHGQIEQERLACQALNHGHDRQSRAFLVRWLRGTTKQHRLSH
jgi:hypothetical protein